MKISTILFDFDGTIVNTTPGILETMTHTLNSMGRLTPEAETMKATIGLPLVTALKNLGNLSDDEAVKAVETYRKLFPEYEPSGTTIFDGVKETLSCLRDKGIRMAICTSRDNFSLDLIMQPRGLAEFFENRVTINDNLAHKPAPDMALCLMEKMGVSAEECIVVGDTTYDILMGNAAGCRTCAVTYGNHDRETIGTASPTYMIDAFSQLKDIVLESK